MVGRGKAVSDSKTLDNGRVLYIEPNTLSSGKFGYEASQKMVPNPEDFSMFVDLEAITYDRFTGEESRIGMSYDGTQTSVMAGSVGFIIKGGKKRFLTTSILDTSFDDIQKGNNTEGLCIDSIDISYNAYNFPEVNIKFTDVRGVSLMSPADYYAFSKDVQGVDGLNLDNGQKRKNADFFARSFVSTFFRFPYPRYVLRVKGFYGYPVTYELCVTDFKTSFNKSSGNFDINVKFIGYMFGCLTDIPVRALLYAPYDESIGSKYWQKQVEDGEFVYDNGLAMNKFVELAAKVKALSKASDENEDIRGLMSEVGDLSNKRAAVQNLRDSVWKFIDSHPIHKKITLSDASNTATNLENGTITNGDEWQMIILPFPILTRGKNIMEKNHITIAMGLSETKTTERNKNYNVPIEYDKVKEGKMEVFKALEKYSDTFKVPFPSEYDNEFGKDGYVYYPTLVELTRDSTTDEPTGDFTGIDDDSWVSILKDAGYDDELLEKGKFRDSIKEALTEVVNDIKDNKYTGLYYVDVLGKRIPFDIEKDKVGALCVGFINSRKYDDFCDEKLKSVNVELQNKSSAADEAKNELLEKLIGFKPSIKNIMDTVLAHLDTFIEIVSRTSEKIKNSGRTVGSVIPGRIADTDIVNAGQDSTTLPPFFTLLQDTITDGVFRKEEKWLGADPMMKDLDEVNLVNSFLNGVIRSSRAYDDTAEKIASMNTFSSGPLSTGAEAVYSLVYDAILTDTNPYVDVLNTGNVNGDREKKLFGLFTLRLITAAYTFKSDMDLLKKFAQLEAEAFSKTDAFKNGDLPRDIEHNHLNGDDVKNNLTKSYYTSGSGSTGVYYSTASKDLRGPIEYRDTLLGNKGRLAWKSESGNQVFPLLAKNIDETRKTGAKRIVAIPEGKTGLANASLTDGFKLIDDDIPSDVDARVSTIVTSYGDLGEKVAPFKRNVENWKALMSPSGATNTSTYTSAYNFSFLKETSKEIPDDFYEVCHVEKSTTFSSSTGTPRVITIKDDDGRKYKFSTYTLNWSKLDLNLTDDYSFRCLPGTKSDNTTNIFHRKTFFQGNNILPQAFIFLHSLPTASYRCIKNFVDVFKDGKRSTSCLIGSFPKSLVLFVGALYWRWLIMENGGEDPIDYDQGNFQSCSKDQFFQLSGDQSNDNLITFNPIILNSPSYSYKEPMKYISVSQSGIFEMPQDLMEIFKNFFIVWANGDFKSTIRQYLYDESLNSAEDDDDILGIITASTSFARTTIPPYLLIGYSESNGKRRIVNTVLNPQNPGVKNITKLVFSPVAIITPYPAAFVFNDGCKMDDAISLSPDNAKEIYWEFYDALYEKTVKAAEAEEKLQEDIDKAKTAQTTDAVKLGLYQAFKNLYNKWLISTKRSYFKFYRDKAKYSGEDALGKQFIYINSFYEKIDDKLMLDITKVGGIIDNAMRDEQNTYSLYNLIYEFANQSNVQLLALPVYTDWSDTEEFVKIFTPLPYEDFAQLPKKAGNTYVFIYTEKPSYSAGISPGVNDSDILYKYKDDSFMVCDVNRWEFSHNLPSTLANNAAGEKVRCFGVTFAKDNQSIFKGIDINMDNPRTTEYSLANQFLLASQFSSEPNSVPTVNGQNLFKIYSNYSYQANVEMLGCPSIMPLMYFQLNNIPMFRGTYIIINVKHSIRPGSMTTVFTGQRLGIERTEYSKEIGLSLTSKADGDTGSTYSSTSSKTYSTLTTYTLDGNRVPKENFYSIAKREGKVTNIKTLYALKKVLSLNDVKGVDDNGQSIMVGDGGRVASSFFGIWRTRGTYYLTNSYESFGKFLEDEDGGAEKQSMVFGKAIIKKTYAEKKLSEYLNSNDWGGFYDGYFEGNFTKMTRQEFIDEMDKAMELYSDLTVDGGNERTCGVNVVTPAIFDEGHDELPQFDVASAVNWMMLNMQPSYRGKNMDFPNNEPYKHKSWDFKDGSFEKEYSGWCTLFTVSGLWAGGLTIPRNNAYKMLPYFNSSSVDIVVDGQNYHPTDLWEDVTASVKKDPAQGNDVRPINCQPGDIAIFEPDDVHKYGHIQMCLGHKDNGDSIWASDFFQRNTWHGCKSITSRYYVFRYKNRQSYSRQLKS